MAGIELADSEPGRNLSIRGELNNPTKTVAHAAKIVARAPMIAIMVSILYFRADGLAAGSVFIDFF